MIEAETKEPDSLSPYDPASLPGLRRFLDESAQLVPAPDAPPERSHLIELLRRQSSLLERLDEELAASPSKCRYTAAELNDIEQFVSTMLWLATDELRRCHLHRNAGREDARDVVRGLPRRLRGQGRQLGSLTAANGIPAAGGLDFPSDMDPARARRESGHGGGRLPELPRLGVGQDGRCFHSEGGRKSASGSERRSLRASRSRCGSGSCPGLLRSSRRAAGRRQRQAMRSLLTPKG